LLLRQTKLPEWFSGETVSFSNRKNLELTSVVVGVIISINHNIHIPIKREEMPGIIDVEAKVFKHTWGAKEKCKSHTLV
jgi:hypothetical protein